MRHPLFTEVASPGFFYERQAPAPALRAILPESPPFRGPPGFERDRRLPSYDACFHEHHRNMKPFPKRARISGVFAPGFPARQNGPLDRTQVTDQFASRLPPFRLASFSIGPEERHLRRAEVCFALAEGSRLMVASDGKVLSILASDPVTVYISARYICSGSSVRSPNGNGGTGEVGVRMASTLLNASRKSWAISERTFCPFK